MLAISSTCLLPAPPEFVWEHYTNVGEWHKWANDIEHATPDHSKEPIKVGTTGRCKYRLLPEGSFVFTVCEQPSRFALEWTMLATTVRFDHELTAWGRHGTFVVETVSFSGLLALPLGLAERPRIRTDWPAAMAALGRLALESWRREQLPPSRADVPRPALRTALVAAEGPSLDGAGEVVPEPRVDGGDP